MDKYTVFYSWQSDKPDAKRIIANRLNAIKSELENQDICLVIDQDTRSRIGTENIDNSVLKKIDDCDIFVADLTPVTQLSPRKEGAHIKLLPNSNVMYEYGYAKGVGKMDRCILLASLDNGENKEDLPFDINHDTISEFKNESGLNGLKGWILKIVEDIRGNNVTVLSVNAGIHFDSNEDVMTINPQFIQCNYVMPLHSYISDKGDHSKSVYNAIDTLSSSAQLIQKVMADMTQPIAQAQIVKPITKKTFLNRCPLSFVISNLLDSPLTNCKVYISCSLAGVCFFDTRAEEMFGLPIRLSHNISISENLIFKHWEIINPKESLNIGNAYISVPHDVNEVVLDWHISSAQGNSFGQLLVKVEPNVEFKEIESEKLAGTSSVEGKTITE